MKNILFLLTAYMLSFSFSHAGAENKLCSALLKVPNVIYTQLENKVGLLFENKMFTIFMLSSIGSIAALITYQTIRDIYNKIPLTHTNSHHLGDKVLCTVMCWIMVAIKVSEYKD